MRYELLPYDELKTKVEQQFFAGGTGYDVIMADCIWIPSFAARGFLAVVDTTALGPASEYGFSDLLPSLDDYLGRYPRGGPRYGLPFMSNVHMMAYRPSIVAPVAQRLRIRLPGTDSASAWTWSQYLQVAQAITGARGNRADRPYGTSLQARAGAWLVYEWYSVLFGFVADTAARATGLPTFDSSAARAMGFYAAMYRQAPPAALTWGHAEETSAMCSGLTAMDATSNVELASDLLQPQCGDSGAIRFAFPPVGVTGRASPDMGGYGLVVTARSPHLLDASKLILWAASKSVHRRIVIRGGSPIRASEVSDSEVLARYPFLRFYDALIATAVYRARIPQWPEFQDVLSRELTAVMQGQRDSRSAAMAVQEWLRQHVAKAAH